jgi:hypothetical protein
MMSDVLADIRFGLEGDATTSQVRGFSYPEPGFTWSVGRDVALRIDFEPGPPPTMIEAELSPFVPGPQLPEQRLVLRIDGTEIAADCVARDGTLGYWIPEGVQIGSSCLIEFSLPDAARPKDFGGNLDPRRLGFKFHRVRMLHVPREPQIVVRSLPPLWRDQPTTNIMLPEYEDMVERLCGQSVHDLMFELENLGSNCEFGLLQRRCGAEPLSLLRFAGIALPFLLKALEADFAGIDDPAETGLEIVGPEREFFFRNDRYGIRGHTWRLDGSSDAGKVLTDVLRNMRFYRRKFHEDLSSGGRLYVFQTPGFLSTAHALPLLTALRRHGDCSLLVVCDTPHLEAGAVEHVSPHLFRGCLKTFAPLSDVSQSDLPSWLSICANAWRMWRGDLRDASTVPQTEPAALSASG